MTQASLLDDAPSPARRRGAGVLAAPATPEIGALAARLPTALRLGTSSWSFPGWRGLVWSDDDYAEAALSRHGLPAYASHPLLRTVSLDRAFYRPLTASQYAACARQVPDGFRFVVKAPALVCDAVVRAPDGRGMTANEAFLHPGFALDECLRPLQEGLGDKAGVLVFQLSPLPAAWLARLPEVLDRLHHLLAHLRAHLATPGPILAVEVRNPEFLTPAFAALLRAHGATYCLGVHARLPPLEAQLPVLRALWPGPLVCRWNLNSRHGAFGYEDAKALYAPFDRRQDPDDATHETLARVIAGTTGAGQPAYVTINNKAEGSAPLSVLALAQAVARRLHGV